MRWRSQKRFFSPTVDEVLRGAPCEVMVVAYPQGVLEEEAAQGDAAALTATPKTDLHAHGLLSAPLAPTVSHPWQAASSRRNRAGVAVTAEA